MSEVIAVAALKGGVGKSTIAVNVAGDFSAARRSVVLVDSDPQGSATAWAHPGRLPFRVVSMPLEGGRDVTQWVQRVLALAADVLILDCPPRLADATRAAVGLADLVLVPVTASGVDLVATSSVLDLVREARTRRKDSGPKLLLVPSRIDRRTASGREIDTALKQFDEPVGPAVHQRSVLADSFTAGEWIGQYAPSSAAREDLSSLMKVIRKALPRK